MKTLRFDRRWLLSLALVVSVPAWALDLATLTGLLAQRKGGEARFTEERFVSGIDGPLRAAGVLSFAAPDQIGRASCRERVYSSV